MVPQHRIKSLVKRCLLFQIKALENTERIIDRGIGQDKKNISRAVIIFCLSLTYSYTYTEISKKKQF